MYLILYEIANPLGGGWFGNAEQNSKLKSESIDLVSFYFYDFDFILKDCNKQKKTKICAAICAFI